MLRKTHDWISDFLRVLWVCRVAVTSVAIGWLLLWQVPQARDLFIDVPSADGGWQYAVILLQAVFVAAAVLCFWAMPVFSGATKALESQHWMSGDPTIG